MFECSSERRFVRERAKRMYVCEEVVNEEFESGERAYRFGIEDGMRGKGCQRGCDIIRGWRRREAASIG